MGRLLRRFLTLPALWRVPGLVADNAADFGLLGLANNADLWCNHIEQITTAGTNSTLTAAQSRRSIIYLNSGASGGFTITLPATSAILSAFGGTVFTDGTFAKPLWIVNNNVGQTGTLTAGDASTTITGTATIATNTCRMFVVQVATASTLTYFNCGSMSL